VSAADAVAPSARAPRASLWLGLAIAVLALAGGGYAVHVVRGREATDDAFVEGAIVRVSAQEPGRVAEVLVGEHQQVEEGQVLVRLDRREYEVRLEAARAQLAAARNRVAEAEASSAAADAEGKAAQVELWREGRELERLRTLRREGAVSQSDLDAAQAARDAAAARVRALGLKAEAARAVLGNEAPVREAEAALHDAELALSYTEVKAPFAGTVGRKNVEPGAVVAAGQPLLALIGRQEFWVMANFKETQIRRMRVGDPAEVRIDALPDVVWRGHVDSFSPATGAKYALIAPEPAAGNFTKVVQRVPVKIVLDGLAEGDGSFAQQQARLAAGLSAEVKVALR
jgi:membrane fusion protein (multidrug efflux system)